MARRRSKKRGNGEGTVYPRADGTWCGQITVATDYITGKVKRKTFYAATQGEVVNKMKDFRATNPLAATGSQMRLKEACDFWLAGQQSRVSDSSMTNYRHALGHVHTYLGDVRLGELSALGVQQGLDRMAAAGLSVSRRGYVLGRLRAVLRKCVRMGLVLTNVALVVDMPRGPKVQIIPLTPAQVAALLKEAEGDPYEAMYWLALDSGARQGELFALAWPDVDLDKGEVYINKNLRRAHGGPIRIEAAKTAGSNRRIGLTQKTVARLKAHKSRRWHAIFRGPCHLGLPPEGLVFTAPKGGLVHHQPWYYGHWMPLLIPV
jgi:integrase